MELYSLKDVKAGTFANPVSFLNRAVAIRSLGDVAQQPESMLAKHGYDFALYHIGAFDTSSGQIVPLDTPDFVITVGELLPAKQAAA